MRGSWDRIDAAHKARACVRGTGVSCGHFRNSSDFLRESCSQTSSSRPGPLVSRTRVRVLPGSSMFDRLRPSVCTSPTITSPLYALGKVDEASLALALPPLELLEFGALHFCVSLCWAGVLFGAAAAAQPRGAPRRRWHAGGPHADSHGGVAGRRGRSVTRRSDADAHKTLSIGRRALTRRRRRVGTWRRRRRWRTAPRACHR